MMSASDVLHQGSGGGGGGHRRSFNRPGGGGGGSGGGSSGGASSGVSSSSSGAVVRPAPVTEKSLLESVAGFINEVQVFNAGGGAGGVGGPGADPRVHVTWARFEVADINDAKVYPDGAEVNGNSPPLLLVLGYTAGVQIWLIPVTGEAQEVLSWKQGTVKTLRVLSTPELSFGMPDNFAHCRPLIAMADSTGPGSPFSSASFISLKTGEQVHNIKFNSEIADIIVNRRVVVTSFKEKLAVFDACTLEARFTITSCYPSPGVVTNPITLGDRWLAYADQKLVPIHRSFGGQESDSSQSMAAWGINVGSKLAQGVSRLYTNLFSASAPSSYSRTGVPSSGSSVPHSPTMKGGDGGGTGVTGNEPQKGVVTILDIMRVYKTERDEVNIGDKIDGVVAHFVAHNKAIVALQFDHSGSLLLTCDRLGNYFNLFRILPHPAGAGFAAVHHLYALFRGDTPGSVQDVAFSPDSRWVTVSTLRGTTHIFPITPYGGPVGVRTHTSARVVNRLSRFHRSAGIDEHRAAATASAASSSSGRTSPSPNLSGTSPISSSFGKMPSMEMGMGGGAGSGPPLVLAYPNPHMPPYPIPTLIQPVAQLRQPYIVSLTNQTIGSATSVSRKKSFSGSSPSSEDVPIRLAVTFGPSRAWLVGTQHNMFNRQQRRAHDSLYVMANHGVLLEYSLDAIPDSTLPKEKICESSPIELVVTAYGQWTLTQPRDRADLQPPLPIDSPLLLPSPSAFDRVYGLPAALTAAKRASMDDSDEEKWLSQVEIVTHFGPHRRLWMGPQFCFKTLHPAEEGNGSTKVLDLDISLPSRPEQSNPVNMPTTSVREERYGKIPVLIEAGSASSFELSPRFSNAFARMPTGSCGGCSRCAKCVGKRDSQNVEKELQEAMSETLIEEDSLLDGPLSWRKTKGSSAYSSSSSKKRDSSEEEFFCLTPEDCRSLTSSRSRNASATSQSSQKMSSAATLQMTLPDTKIFSVAVEARKSEQTKTDSMKVCDVDADFSGRFAVVSQQKEERRRSDKAGGAKGETTMSHHHHHHHQQQQQQQEAANVDAAVDDSSAGGAAAAASSGKKQSKGRKKKKGGKSSSDEAPAEEIVRSKVDNSRPLVLNSVGWREVTPCKSEEAEELKLAPRYYKTAEAAVSFAGDELISKEAVRKLEKERTEEDLSTHSDDFLEISNTKVDSDVEEEDQGGPSSFFARREKSAESMDESEDVNFDGKTAAAAAAPHYDPETSAASWIDDFLRSDSSSAILRDIESAGRRWEGSNSNSSRQQQLVESTGFQVDLLSGPSFNAAADSSEDDSEFKLASNGRFPAPAKRRQQQQSNKDGSAEFSSSFNQNDDGETKQLPVLEQKEGWSFEADDYEVNRLISEVVSHGLEEKTSLEDVFKFDSEMSAAAAADDDDDDEEEQRCNSSSNLSSIWRNKNPVQKAVSLEDLQDALHDTTTEDDSEDCEKETGNSATAAVTGGSAAAAATKQPGSIGGQRKLMATSLNVTFDEESLISPAAARDSVAGLSSSFGSTSESSVGNSPNPKKNNANRKKKKKKK